MRRTVRRYLCGAGAATAAVVAGLVGCALLLLAPGTLTAFFTPAVDSCTVFAVKQRDTVYLGNNEDYPYAESAYWVDPGEEGEYDVLYFGLDDLRPRGGVNEKGLCYDATGLPEALLNRHYELTPLKIHFPILALRRCTTVEEVIALAQSYDWGRHMRYQALFADATGDAVVISPGFDGELAFTRKSEGNAYLIATNFNLGEKYYGEYPCERYDTAAVMLEETKTDTDLTVELCRDVLAAVEQSEAAAYTLYSTITDPVEGLVYVYYLRQFDSGIVLDVAELLETGEAAYSMRALFPVSLVTRAEAAIPEEPVDVRSHVATALLIAAAAVAVARIESVERGKHSRGRPAPRRWLRVLALRSALLRGQQ